MNQENSPMRSILAKKFVDILHYWCEKEKITQKRVAEKSSISPAEISQVIKNKKWFSPDALVRIANTMHISFEYFYLAHPDLTPDRNLKIVEQVLQYRDALITVAQKS